MSRNRLRVAAAVVLVGLVVAAAAVLALQRYFRPTTITAFFATATSIYPGDEVWVAGVKVGTIKSVEPQGTRAKMTLTVDHDVPIPADAKAVIAAQNLVASRYVQLAPAYRGSGPKMPDGAMIPIERTAVPVEWDEVKGQLNRLATDLGPTSKVSGTSVGRVIDSAAAALDGNGGKLRQTIAQLSGVGRILAQGSGNIADIIQNLQLVVNALEGSSTQIVQFEDRLATLSSVIDASDSDLDAALKDLSVAVGEVQRFVAGTRDKAVEQIQRLGEVTQVLVGQRMSVKNILHVAPNAAANGYGIYNPDTGNARGAFGFTNLSNPIQYICASIGAVENVTAEETGKLCAQYLGPALRVLNLNFLPLPTNYYLSKSASPQNIIYSEPSLAPGGAGGKPVPPETPPVVSAYTGLYGELPPPAWLTRPPYPHGIYAPEHLPAYPSPALFPGAPVPPGPASLPEMLLPAEAAPPPAAPPAEGTPPS